MAYVGAVYSIDRFCRTTDEVLDETARRARQADRPRPQQKHVWAELTRLSSGEKLNGRSLLFAQLAVECYARDPDRQKQLICLMDGEEPLWEAKAEWLSHGVEVLDFFHVSEHLWKIAECFHKRETAAAQTFVEHYTRMILDGKVGYVVRELRRLCKQQDLRGKRKQTVFRGLGYFRRNRRRMRYDEYLAKGYPIGSGVAEGACRNLVKDRLELSGMRWEHHGAQSMLHLRALKLNDEWSAFITHRIKTEQDRLYGPNTIYAKTIPYQYGQSS
jgi:hypothetical protein